MLDISGKCEYLKEIADEMEVGETTIKIWPKKKSQKEKCHKNLGFGTQIISK